MGLGGRDITPSLIEEIFSEGLDYQKKGKIADPVRYLGVRR
jgi:hypothetical protein